MSQLHPLVSVIIPTHNSAAFVERCIDTVLNQSEKTFEILAIDDQSTDDTKSILKRYENRLDNFRYFETPQWTMAGGARNIGLENHVGKYVCFIDSDDWIDTNYLHYMISSVEESGADIAVCGVKREYPNAKDSTVRYKYNRSNVITGAFALGLLSRVIDQDVAISAIPTNKLFRSNFIRKFDLRFPEKSINEDDVFMFQALLHAQRVSITDMTYYHLFQRPNSVSRTFSRKNISDLIAAFREIREDLERKDLFLRYQQHFYAFFEKCFQYVLETMQQAVQDEQSLNDYLQYAYEISREVIPFREFIKYCGYRRIERFFQ